MNSDDLVRLLHMLEASREAVEFLKDQQRDVLNQDRKLALALVKDIELICEAASRVAEE